MVTSLTIYPLVLLYNSSLCTVNTISNVKHSINACYMYVYTKLSYCILRILMHFSVNMFTYVHVCVCVCVCVCVLRGVNMYKGKGHPITGHEGPEGE
jgi:hypothetical protein